MAWVGLGEVVLGLRGVVLRLGVVGFGVRVLGLGRYSLGLRRGVLGFWAQWIALGHWGSGLGVGGVVWGLDRSGRGGFGLARGCVWD